MTKEIGIMTSPWHFGNTTVRNPSRIRDGLIVLKNSLLNGNLVGQDNEMRFADELERAGVVTIANKERDYSDLGRKWRSCFSQLGFITHKFTRNMGINEVDQVIYEVQAGYNILGLSGRPYEITPSGLRMIQAESVQQQNECMLRALLAYELPSIIEPNNGTETFNPFILILQVLRALSLLEEARGLSKAEMSIVQVCRSHEEIFQVINKIQEYRTRYDAVTGRVNKRRVENELLQKIADETNLARGTMKDYADVNFRYPRLTGLVSLQGKRLVLNPNKLPIIDAILQDFILIGKERSNAYLIRLWQGAELPTDNEANAISEIQRFRQLLIESDYEESQLPAMPAIGAEVAEINLLRIRFEELYQLHLEELYAKRQSEQQQVKEIIAYLKALDKQRVDTDFEIEIDDEPSYLEWAIWRAFLAVNHLINKPHEARRFKVDQDFLPLSCASGGGADMIFEFEDYALVVEVTLTSSSRQEAAEGEPVRRHVAKEKAKYRDINKPVYGLFLARTIDNNTAETFRIGVWYHSDEPDFINIVPLTLSQFIRVMEKFLRTPFENQHFKKLLDDCLITRNAHAPAWKREIEKSVISFVS